MKHGLQSYLLWYKSKLRVTTVKIQRVSTLIPQDLLLFSIEPQYYSDFRIPSLDERIIRAQEYRWFSSCFPFESLMFTIHLLTPHLTCVTPLYMQFRLIKRNESRVISLLLINKLPISCRITECAPWRGLMLFALMGPKRYSPGRGLILGSYSSPPVPSESVHRSHGSKDLPVFANMRSNGSSALNLYR